MGPTTNTGSGAAVVDNSAFGGPNSAQAAAGNSQIGAKPIVPTYQTPTPANIPGTPGYNPGYAAPTEPTVVSSDNITNNVIPALNAQATAVAQKGTYVGGDGKTYYSDGSLVPAPLSADYDETTGTYSDASGTYGAPPQFVDNPTNDPDIAQTNTLLASLKNSLDSSTLSQVNAIEQQYKLLTASQQQANAGQDSAEAALNARTGTTRYAPLNAMSTAIATTNSGLAKIQKLDADEDAAIAQVKSAQQSGDYQLMTQALDTVNSIRTAKQTAATTLQDSLSKTNDAAQAQALQVGQDNAVGSVLAQGTTDPATILKAVNDAGYNMTAAQVAASIKNLTPTAAAGSTYKFSNTDVGKLLGVGLNPTQIQNVQDYYNGTGTADALSGLTSAQQAAVQTALVGKTATASSDGGKSYKSGTLNYTSDDLAQGNQLLQQSKGTDGYVDPNVYLNLANAWTSQGGSIKDFLTNYPISSWVNPANTFVTPAINALIKQDAAGTKTTSTSASGRTV